MSSEQQRAPQSGFTLLELLVAITILALIMTAAMGAVRLGDRSFAAGVSRADETAEMRVVANVLRRQFRQLLPMRWTANRHEFIAFEGGRDYLQFIAPAPDSSAGPGYLVYRLAARQSDTTDSLVVYFSPFDPGSDRFVLPAGSRHELLAENIQVSFDYFGTPGERDQPGWHDEWQTDAINVPVIVRMRLATAGQPWPELLFRVRFGDEQ